MDEITKTPNSTDRFEIKSNTRRLIMNDKNIIGPYNAFHTSKMIKNRLSLSGEMRNDIPSKIHEAPITMNKRTKIIKLI